MKTYPVQEFTVCDLETGKEEEIVSIPTPEAVSNFEKYLDENELVFYKQLDVINSLDVRLSVNPFNALLNKMTK